MAEDNTNHIDEHLYEIARAIRLGDMSGAEMELDRLVRDRWGARRRMGEESMEKGRRQADKILQRQRGETPPSLTSVA